MFYEDSQKTNVGRALSERGPAIRHVHAPERWGGRERLTEVLREFPGRIAHVSGAPGDTPTVLARASAETGSAEATWVSVWATVLASVRQDREPTLWWVSDMDRLEPAGWSALARIWAEVRARALPVHLVLGDHRDAPDTDAPPSLSSFEIARLRIGPPTLRDLAGGMAAWSPSHRIVATLVFGDDSRIWREVDPSVRLSTNIQRLILDSAAPLLRVALDRIQLRFQRPERYLSVVDALAAGPADWGTIRKRSGLFPTSSQLGPYLASLEEHGIVAVDRSLDADPRTRARRYRLTDSHTAFWFACVYPGWSRLGLDSAPEIWSSIVEPRIADFAERAFPELVRRWISGSGPGPSYAPPGLPSPGRDVGGLWGDGYEFPVAGTLKSGAVLYGRARWRGGDVKQPTLDEMTDQLRRTRYGFGRERRVRLVAQRDVPGHALARRAAREEDLIVVDARHLAGD